MKKLMLALILTLPLSAQSATCTQVDLGGSWKIYSVFDSPARCTLIMPSNSSTVSTTSTCYLPGVVASTPLRGTLNIAADCHVYGTITIGTLSRSIDGYISKGKDSISGAAWQPGNVYIGNQFSGVKQ
ncbi:MAG: hypothetical protein PHU14_14430 [Methylovulum sp.]|nr:hypothetical protein [Methylovulum sp.]